MFLFFTNIQTLLMRMGKRSVGSLAARWTGDLEKVWLAAYGCELLKTGMVALFGGGLSSAVDCWLI